MTLSTCTYSGTYVLETDTGLHLMIIQSNSAFVLLVYVIMFAGLYFHDFRKSAGDSENKNAKTCMFAAAGRNSRN